MKSSSKEFDIEEEKSDQIDISSIKDSFNIVIMGDSLVGKTSILERFCNDFFKKEKYANILYKFIKKFSYITKKNI